MPRVWILSLLPLFALPAPSQTTFIYDQQSFDESHILEGVADIQQIQPMGQSFTPTLSSVGFIRLEIYSGLSGNVSAATMDINLRANSITGTILGTSETVAIPAGGGVIGPVNFFYDAPVTVTPGTTYYFQPVVLDNNNIATAADAYNYSGGTGFANGSAVPNADLWFREGITVIPEPSLVSLLVICGLTALGLRRRN